MDAVRKSIQAQRQKPGQRIDPETGVIVSRDDDAYAAIPDEMATIKDSSVNPSEGKPSVARKLRKEAIDKSYKERLRRYGKEWHKVGRPISIKLLCLLRCLPPLPLKLLPVMEVLAHAVLLAR